MARWAPLFGPDAAFISGARACIAVDVRASTFAMMLGSQ